MSKRKAANSIMLRIGAKNGGVKLKIRFSTVMIFSLLMAIGFIVSMDKLGNALNKEAEAEQE
jgi:hypothetical protein